MLPEYMYGIGVDDVWHCMGIKMGTVLNGMGVVWNGMGATCMLMEVCEKYRELCVWELIYTDRLILRPVLNMESH